MTTNQREPAAERTDDALIATLTRDLFKAACERNEWKTRFEQLDAKIAERIEDGDDDLGVYLYPDVGDDDDGGDE